MAQLALFNEGVRDHFPILWLCWPSLMWGYSQRGSQMQKCCSAGPQECIFMAPLALFNEGIRDHFYIWW